MTQGITKVLKDQILASKKLIKASCLKEPQKKGKKDSSRTMKGLITIKECDQSLTIEYTRSKHLASVDLGTDMMPGPASNNRDQWRIQPENGPRTRRPSRRRLQQGRQAKQGRPSLGPSRPSEIYSRRCPLQKTARRVPVSPTQHK